ncbi:sensor histidine kinase [Staphylococcus pasteuri]|uniref:HAMP domain-containing sensor histidine kinase n=4 Tax=Staphylococcus pasteuri TaxID=45972 RepID=UPI003CFDA4D0
MNKRFILKFFKYLTTFLTLSFVLIIITIVLMINLLMSASYSDIKSIDPDYFLSNKIKDIPYTHLNNLAKKENAELYVTNHKGDILYPKNFNKKNVKSLILNNINYANAIPTSKEEKNYIVYIYKNNHQSSVKNAKHIKTHQLLQSITTHDYNKYNYNYQNNKIGFYKNSNQNPISSKSFSQNDIANKLIDIPKILIIALIINVVLALITSYLVSRRLTKPLGYYIDWIGNLSKEKLHQPNTKGNIKKYSKTYPELHTSLTLLNQQLLQDKMYQNQINYYKSKWISQISHDLKSPLTSIYGYSKIIEVDDSNKKYLNLISEKAKYMEDLIQSLNKDFDKETNQMKHDKESFPIQYTVEKFVSSIGYDNIELSFLFDQEETFYGNKLYFERCLINLIENSIEHNNLNPKINILFDKIENTLLIDYKDNGQGLPSNKNDIFKPGYSTKATNKVNHGLGLTIIKEAIDYHNGSIHIIPTTNGVHFKIKLISQI